MKKKIQLIDTPKKYNILIGLYYSPTSSIIKIVDLKGNKPKKHHSVIPPYILGKFELMDPLALSKLG